MLGANKDKGKERKSDHSVIFSSPFQLFTSGGQNLRKLKALLLISCFFGH